MVKWDHDDCVLAHCFVCVGVWVSITTDIFCTCCFAPFAHVSCVLLLQDLQLRKTQTQAELTTLLADANLIHRQPVMLRRSPLVFSPSCLNTSVIEIWEGLQSGVLPIASFLLLICAPLQSPAPLSRKVISWDEWRDWPNSIWSTRGHFTTDLPTVGFCSETAALNLTLTSR